MTRFSIIAAFAALMTFFHAETADAQVTGTREDLLFVSETNIPSANGGTMSLCHLVDHQIVLFMPVYTWSKEYAWAANECDTDEYLTLAALDLTEMKNQGMVYPDIPDTPVLPAKVRVKNWIVGGTLGAVGLFLVLNFIRRKYRAVMG